MEYGKLFGNWPLTFVRRREDVTISGSPNRSAERFVWEDEEGKLYVAEGFGLSKRQSQCRQSRWMEFLAEQGFPVVPWLRTVTGEAGVSDAARFWQIRPFAEADPLPRETLGDDPVRARAWEGFLRQMAGLSGTSSLPLPVAERFDFSAYLTTLGHYLDHQMRELSSELHSVLAALAPFFAAEPDLPAAPAHGDFHPGNVLMKQDKITAVIDWEFSSWKCAGYDLALLTGCLGMDQIRWLVSGESARMRERFFSDGVIPAEVRRFFPELVAAVRLGWLGEWVDLNDREMAERELYFIRMILHNRSYLV